MTRARFAWIRISCMALCCIGVSGCSLEDPKPRDFRLSVLLQESPAALEALEKLGMRFDALAATTTADFNCFGMNITGPGIAPSRIPNGCSSPSNMGGTGPGVFSSMKQRGLPLEADVATGKDRNIQIYGFYPPTAECGGNSIASAGYLLGARRIDLADSTSVTIPVAFTSGQAPTVSCSTTGGAGTPLPIFQVTGADPSGSPCTTVFSNFPATPTASLAASLGTSLSLTYIGADDGMTSLYECSPVANEAVYLQFVFDPAGINLGGFTRMKVLWKGQAGVGGASCTGTPPSTGSTTSIALYRHNFGAGSTWTTIGTYSSPLTQVLTQTITDDPTAYVANGKLVVRMAVNAPGSNCVTISTDFVTLELLP